VYEEHRGWSEDITKVKKYEDLPQLARDYVLRIEDLAGVPIRTVSVGPGREATLTKD
jgi:adenylosuccinate synthase